MRINKNKKDTIQFINQYQLSGLKLQGVTELNFAEPTSEVNLYIAHFGEPPKVTAFSGRKEVITIEVSDYPRQLEFVRLLGANIDRVVIETGGSALLAQVRYWLDKGEHQADQTLS